MAFSPERSSSSIQQAQIRKILAKQPGIEDQVMAGSPLPLEDVGRGFQWFIPKIVDGKTIADRINFRHHQLGNIMANRRRIPKANREAFGGTVPHDGLSGGEP